MGKRNGRDKCRSLGWTRTVLHLGSEDNVLWSSDIEKYTRAFRPDGFKERAGSLELPVV